MVLTGFEGKIAKDFRINPDNDPSLYGMGRAKAVKEYLKTHEHNDFLILDDCDFGFDNVLGIKRLILTDPDNGITYQNMKDTMSLVGQWK